MLNTFRYSKYANYNYTIFKNMDCLAQLLGIKRGCISENIIHLFKVFILIFIIIIKGEWRMKTSMTKTSA